MQGIEVISERIWKRNQQFIPGGVVSLNRSIQPMRVFVKAHGAYLWDAEGKKHIDYHAAFSPHLLGHGDEDITRAVIRSLEENQSLVGAGTTPWEGKLAELLVEAVPGLEMVQITNTGSEATYAALRLARSVTGRDGILLMQGGYNGWHDDVAFNLMDPLQVMSDWHPGQEHALRPISGGIPKSVTRNIHVVEFNDLEAAEAVLSREDVAALILEPILQNVGVVKPRPGYLEDLRSLCDRHGTLLIFDEVKTGFRSALGGFQEICGVNPDLSTFGKAVASGYPLGVIGGKKQFMDYFVHEEPAKRVLIAGTYNAHPVPVAAAIATLQKLKTRKSEIYGSLEHLGSRMERGLTQVFEDRGITVSVVRQGSAFVVYFMDHQPESWVDIARHHDFEKDRRYRLALAERGIFHFPLPVKQGSISTAHTDEDIDKTIDVTHQITKSL